jgi:uncharacterized protein YigA (DUF484 family)
MFNIFKKIKQLKMENEQLEQENVYLKTALLRANTANNELNETIKKMANDLEAAIGRVRYLAEQLKMKDAQQSASIRFNDNERSY